MIIEAKVKHCLFLRKEKKQFWNNYLLGNFLKSKSAMALCYRAMNLFLWGILFISSSAITVIDLKWIMILNDFNHIMTLRTRDSSQDFTWLIVEWKENWCLQKGIMTFVKQQLYEFGSSPKLVIHSVGETKVFDVASQSGLEFLLELLRTGILKMPAFTWTK